MTISHPANDILIDDLREFLEQHGRTYKDVMSDEKGQYVMIEDEGRPEDNFRPLKLYLPDNLQELI